MSPEEREERLTAIYSQVPTFTCKEGCTECCSALPYRNSIEAARMPRITVATGGRRQYKCPYLGEKGCTAYETRPFICRIFGTSEDLQCSYAGPERPLSFEESRRLKVDYYKLTLKKEEHHGKETERS